MSTSVSAVPCQSGYAPSARIRTMQRCLQEKGFSEQVATRICSSKRTSTNSVYGYRWKVWLDWCVGRQVDPFSPSVNFLAEFLIFLFEVKKLTPVAIKGYRSAIATTLKHFSDINYSNQPVISNVIRSLELEKPKVSSPVPKWNLPLVLGVLSKSPFESLTSCSLKFLTYKTVFLIALASGRRRSEIHALTADEACVNFTHDESAVELHVYPGFLAKNQLPSVAHTGITIPALPRDTDDSAIHLCPVRALKAYLRRVSHIRKGRHRLFISFRHNWTKEVSASTISRWIVETIKLAYNLSGEQESCPDNVNAHEVRALSTSWAWLNHVPLDKVLRAGYWSSESSFIRFYLRNTLPHARGLFALGPLVAAQSIITSRSVSSD